MYGEKILGIKKPFDISDSIEIREVDIAGVACILDLLAQPSLAYYVCKNTLYLCFPDVTKSRRV